MKIFTGHVVNTKMAKTAVVSVERVVIHPLYKKRFKRDQKYPVQDDIGVKVGDLVKFTACKPYSKTKKWKVLEVVQDKNKVVKKAVEPKAVEPKAVEPKAVEPKAVEPKAATAKKKGTK